MTNLKQIATDLLEKAGKATRPKIMACPKCDSTAAPDWTERSPDGNSQCSNCKKPSANWAWIKQAPIPLDIEPDAITVLAQAYLEAVEMAELANIVSVWMHTSGLQMPAQVDEDSYNLGTKARQFLSKWAAPGEGKV